MNRINLICLGVRDMKKSLEFYKKIGFKTPETEEEPQIVFFNNQGSKLELYPIKYLAEDINKDNPPDYDLSKFSGITLAINLKSKKEVDDFIEKVKGASGEIVKEPEIVSWGGYSGYFKDIDGHYWEVAYGEDWKFDDTDMLIIE